MTNFSPHLPFIIFVALFLSFSFSFFFSFVLPSPHHHFLLRSFLGFSGGLVTAIALVIVKKPPHPLRTDAPRHDVGGFVDHGLASCTEILGFECSHNGRGLMDQLDNPPAEDSCLTGTAADTGAEVCRRTGHRVRKEVRSFPPPLSSLNLNGQPSFFLRPVRKDGRLKLTEVRIHRPKILHAWRHDGRLTLHLIPEGSNLDDDSEYDEEEEEEELEELEEEEEDEEEQEEEMVKAIRDEEEEFRFGDWRFGNEGLRRCHQELNDHGGHDHRLHNHHLQLRVPGVGIA